jgi:hypothetical protein
LSVFSWAVALIVGLSFDVSHKERNQGWPNLLQFTLTFIMVLGTGIVIFRGCFLAEEHTERARQSVQNAPEYNPRAMTDWKRQQIWPTDRPFTLLNGQARVQIERWDAQSRSLVVKAGTPARIRVRLLDYPGWSVFDNGIVVNPAVDATTGAIMLDVPEGLHQIEIRFRSTPWRTGSLILSLVSGMVLLGMSLRDVFGRRMQSQAEGVASLFIH